MGETRREGPEKSGAEHQRDGACPSAGQDFTTPLLQVGLVHTVTRSWKKQNDSHFSGRLRVAIYTQPGL